MREKTYKNGQQKFKKLILCTLYNHLIMAGRSPKFHPLSLSTRTWQALEACKVTVEIFCVCETFTLRHGIAKRKKSRFLKTHLTFSRYAQG